MLAIIIGLGLFFVLLGFVVTERNAKYILSGYNTLSDDERKQIDIKTYLVYFKKFHIFLGISFISIGWLLFNFIGLDALGIFLAVYPTGAYIFLAWIGMKFMKGASLKLQKQGLYILSGAVVIIFMLFYFGFKEDRLNVIDDKLVIEGAYGETLINNEIASIQLVDELPKVVVRINGFALETIRKGYFKTDEGEKIKMIINKQQEEYILIKTNLEKEIYYSDGQISNEELLFQVKDNLPNIVYVD